MIRSPPHLTILLRTSWMMFEGRKAYLRPFSHLSFEASPRMLSCLWDPRLKYQGVQCAWLLANRFTTVVPQHLNNLWVAGSPKLHTWAFFAPCLRASAWRFATLLKYLGHMVTPFLWHLSRIFFTRPFRVLQWVPPFLKQIGHCCCVVYLEGDSFPPHWFLDFLTGHLHCFQFQDIDVGAYASLMQATCLWKTGCSCEPP